MKTKHLYITLAAALCSVSLPLASDIEPKTAVTPAPVAEPATETVSPEGARLRCWQYGELLFEASRLSRQAQAKVPGALEFERDRDAGGKLQLVNIGTATCLYEE